MSRILQYLNPFDEESRAKRAERRERAENFGWYGAKSPLEQAEMAGEATDRAYKNLDEDAAGRRKVALNAAEAVLRGASKGKTMDLGALRKGFDPSNAESVRQMQRMLNQAGFTDEYGNRLEEDGIFGSKTLGALRRMQGGHREDNALIDDLKGGEGSIAEKIMEQEVNDRGKDFLYSREGRGSSTVFRPESSAPLYDMNSKQRQDAVGQVRSGAKSVDDAIEQSAPWLANSSAYRGAKEGLKSFFNYLGDADY